METLNPFVGAISVEGGNCFGKPFKSHWPRYIIRPKYQKNHCFQNDITMYSHIWKYFVFPVEKRFKMYLNIWVVWISKLWRWINILIAFNYVSHLRGALATTAPYHPSQLSLIYALLGVGLLSGLKLNCYILCFQDIGPSVHNHVGQWFLNLLPYRCYLLDTTRPLTPIW
jgi:hypothetical protein